MTTILKAALQYRAEGRSVFPLVNKKPKVKWKDLQGRLATEDELTEWFGRNPSLQIALVTGRVSGNIWVMDADGIAAVDWMEHNAPPTTVYARTKRGRHAYYLMPPGVEVRCGANVIPDLKKSTGNQIDVKGEGGYVVVPPSVYRGGEYRWEISGAGWAGLATWQPPDFAPATSSAFFDGTGFDLTGVKSFGHDLNPVDDGQRNSALASIVGRFIAEGMSLDAILIWATGWNAQCRPPLGPEVLTKTIESIANTHIRNHGSLPAQPVLIEELSQPKKENQPEDGVPSAILHPGGILEQIMGYIKKSTVANYPLFSMAAGLAMIGTLVGQKVMTETGLRTNLYVFALAPSGTGKDAPLSVIPRLLQDAGASDDNLGPNHLASSAGLLARLENNPCQLLLLDEIGDLMGSLKNKNDIAKNDLPKILKSLYSSTARGEIKAYANSKSNVNVNWHHLSFYATGVPGDFWNNLSVSDVTGGFVARALLFSLDILAPFPKEDVAIEPPAALVESIRNLYLLERRHVGNLSSTPTPAKVSKNDEAKKLFTKWHREYHALQNQHRNNPDGRAAVYGRVAENAHKLALIHAVSLTGGVPPCVPVESVNFAIGLMDWMVPIFVGNIAANISHNEQDGLRKRILAMVDRKGSITKREIYRNLNGCTSHMAESAIRILEESGELVLAKVEKKNGRAIYVWVRPQTEEKQ